MEKWEKQWWKFDSSGLLVNFYNAVSYFLQKPYFNIASGSEANITTPCEMEIFNFLWLILDHSLPLTPK